MDKYPRTPHLPFSPGMTDDDETIKTYARLLDGAPKVVITEKIDGGNCCLKDDMVFARTHSKPATHASFSMVKQLYLSQILPSGLVQDEWELFGENMEAVHSIDYTPDASDHYLPSPFFLFAVFDRNEMRWFSWDEVTALADNIGIPTVPVLWTGGITAAKGDQNAEETLKKMILSFRAGGSTIGPKPPHAPVEMEGCVVRVVGSIAPGDFSTSIAKFVRQGHIQTDDTFKAQWKHAKIRML